MIKVLTITSWHQKNKIGDILTSWKIVLKSWRARPLHCLWAKDTKSSMAFVRPLTSIYYIWIITTLRHFSKLSLLPFIMNYKAFSHFEKPIINTVSVSDRQKCSPCKRKGRFRVGGESHGHHFFFEIFYYFLEFSEKIKSIYIAGKWASVPATLFWIL